MLRKLLLLTLAASGLGAEPTLDLVSNGSPLPIVVPEDAPAPERFAADELARYLTQITGRSFTVQNAGADLPDQALLVGRALAENLGESFPESRFGEDGFLLKRSGGRVMIAGADDRGTLYAAYALLERLGCGWYAPNFGFYGKAGGERVPRIADPRIAELDLVEKPTFKWREKYLEEGESDTIPRLIALLDWMAKARLDLVNCAIDYQGEGRTKWDNWRAALIPEAKKRGLMLEIGGHGYQVFLPASRYFKDHPEWFGMYEGRRSDDPREVFCTANPQAVATYIANVRAYLRDHPEIDSFDCRPPDSSRWSTAPEDLALGSPTDRQILLVNRLAAALKPEFPKLKIRFEAYSGMLAPPDRKIVPADDTLLELCPINRSFTGPLYDENIPENRDYMEALKGWLAGGTDPGKVTITTYITKYQWRSLPILIPHLIARECAHFADMGLGGMSNYSEPGAWAALELDHYFLARCLWNARLDPDAELKAYAQGRYGPAAEPVLAYLKLVEAVVPNAVVIPGTHLEFRSEQKYLARFRQGARLLEQARKDASGDPVASLLVDKLDASRRYAENEMELRLAFIEAGTTWRRDQMTKISALMEERRKIIEANAANGLMVIDSRTW